MNLIKPVHLNQNDFIGVVAPAFPFPIDENSHYYAQYRSGCNELEKMGFRVKEGKNLRKREWWRAGTPQERAEDINEMFRDPEVRAIIAHDGGNDCISVLEYIDYEAVKTNPKPFIGFSNVTNLHSAFFTKTGMVGFHMGLLTYELGWVWQELVPNNKSKGYDYFLKALTSTEKLGTILPITPWETWRSGKAEGLLFGGNLSMLDSLVGTPYFPSIDELRGAIFFWEIDNSPTYRIERILTHLKYVGLFDVISGMLVGKLVDMKKTALEGFDEPTHKELVLKVLNGYHFPIIGNVDFGHKIVQIPVPIGISARIDADNCALEYLESATI